jgi:uncharacterized iron-regulated membrane protein
MVLGKRAWFRVHSWLGVITGLLLFILCWSGTLATLAHEIDWVLSPTLRVQEEGKVLSLDKLHTQVRAQYPEAIIKSVHAPIATNRVAYVVVDMPEQQRLRIYVNPYNAEILGTSSSFTVQRFFRSFHITLFNGQFGLYVVWLMAIPLTMSFIAPLIFYKRWWQRFFVLKTNRGWRVLWSDLHKVIGLWSLWFVLVIALTSLWFLFEALRGDIGDGKSVWAAPGNNAIHTLPELRSDNEHLPIRQLIEKVQSARPGLDIKTINLDSGGYLYVDGQDNHLLVRDRANKLYIDPYNGQVVHDQSVDELPLYWRLSDTADPLHFGDFAGLISKLVWFVFGLGLSGICLTGAWLHAQRLQQNTNNRWQGTGAALLATSILIVLAFRGGAAEIKKFGPMQGNIQQWPDIALPVTLFISSWVLITIAIIGYWAYLLLSPFNLQTTKSISSSTSFAK